MEPQESTVQYNRWSNSQNKVSMNMSALGGVDCEQICTKLCTGKLGIAMKVAGRIILFWVIFIIGYVTSYYTHKCKWHLSEPAGHLFEEPSTYPETSYFLTQMAG